MGRTREEKGSRGSVGTKDNNARGRPTTPVEDNDARGASAGTDFEIAAKTTSAGSARTLPERPGRLRMGNGKRESVGQVRLTRATE